MQIRQSLGASLSSTPRGSFLASPSARTKGTTRSFAHKSGLPTAPAPPGTRFLGWYGKGLREDFSLEDCWTLVTSVVEESRSELCLDVLVYRERTTPVKSLSLHPRPSLAGPYTLPRSINHFARDCEQRPTLDVFTHSSSEKLKVFESLTMRSVITRGCVSTAETRNMDVLKRAYEDFDRF